MNPCASVQKCLEEYRYDVIVAGEKDRIEAHLLTCAECKTVFERIRSLERSLQSLADAEEVPKARIKAGVERIVRRGSRRSRSKEVFPMVVAAVLFAGVFAWLVGSSPAPRVSGLQETKGIFEEKRLGVVENQRPQDVVVSPDGKTWAYATRVGESGMAMVIGGETGEVYGGVGRPYFSPDGKKVGYVAVDPKTRMAFVVVGKTRGQDFRSISAPQTNAIPEGRLGAVLLQRVDSALDWAPDSETVAYIGRSDEGLHVVIGDKKSQPYKEIREFAWSPGGHTLAFAAVAGDDSFVVVGDRKGEIFDFVENLTFSPDGATLAYGAREGGRAMIVVGGKKEPSFHGVGRPVFSPDGKVVAHVVSIANGTGDAIAVNGVIDPRYEGFQGILLGELVFSLDGKHLAYKARDNEAQWIVIDGKKETPVPFDQVGRPLFSPDGLTVAYVAMKGSKQVVVVGDRVGEKFSQVSHLTFSPDGKTMAYKAERFGKQVVVAGSSMSEEFEEVREGPFFSSDSKSVAFVIRQGKELWSKVLRVR